VTGTVKPVLDDDEDYTDDSGDPDDPEAVEGHAQPPPIERFHRSAVGTALAAGLFGLRDALEPPKDETPAIVEDWAGGEPFKDPMVLRLDPDNPQDSIVMIRPWLRPSAPRGDALPGDRGAREAVGDGLDTEPGPGRDS
jgi:hypothetical protein